MNRSHSISSVSGVIYFAIAAILILTSFSAHAQDIITTIQAGDVEAANAMLKDDPSLALFTREDGDTPIHQAAFIGDLELIELLISLGADPDCRNERNQSPLLYAAYSGRLEVCRALIEKGLEYDYQDTRGNSPILFAARQGYPEVVKLFIEKGAAVDDKGNGGRTPLFHAAATGGSEIVKMLAEAGAKISTPDDEGLVPILVALRGGFAEVASYLTEKGALDSFNAGQFDEVMHGAAVAGMTDLVKLALERGATLVSKDNGGRTLLHNAVLGGSAEVILIALDGGIDVNAPDGAGQRPIHLAVSSGDRKIVAMMLEKGADPNLKADDGSVPYLVAEDGCYDDILKLLVNKGAKKVTPVPLPVPGRSSNSSEPVEVRYIANEGFIISGRKSTVIFDGIVENPFGYLDTGERILGMMSAGDGPFMGVDLNIASHDHVDHFHPGRTVEFLSAQKDVAFVGNNDSYNNLKATAGDGWEMIGERAILIHPEWGEKTEKEIRGIRTAFFHANHAGPGTNPYPTLESIVDIDGITFLHLADVVAESSEEFIRKALEGESIEIAFLDRFFLEDSIGSLLVEEVIKPDHIIVMHLRENEVDQAYEALRERYPGIIVFRQQLERRLFE